MLKKNFLFCCFVLKEIASKRFLGPSFEEGKLISLSPPLSSRSLLTSGVNHA